MRALWVQLDAAIRGVEAGAKHEDACITLVGPSMAGTGIRPKVVSQAASGQKVYLLNVEQARKLRARCAEALDGDDTLTTTKGASK